jgi:multidrug efflux pump subunit AcrB
MVKSALRRPITVLVLFAGVVLFALATLPTIPIDIFPKLNQPTIYVIESYGGMSPQQMEGFFATRMQDQFLYVTGVRTIESKNIQGLTLIKLVFYEATDMAEASAQVALQVNRASKFFPPGALPPQVIRFDASSLPVGELVLSSPTKSLKEMYDLATTRVRPLFATVPGLSAPPPFGANSRSIVINVDPEKLRRFNVGPDQVVEAIAKNNAMTPAGNLRVGNMMYVTTVNSLEDRVQEFADIPIATRGAGAIFVRDVATVADAADVTVDYALVNGKRSIYIPVVKTAEASTWTVVQTLKARLPEMQSLLPDDVTIRYAFDQSVFVINAVKSLSIEAALGALLTGLMVLLFLRDWRSSVVVVVTIPIAVLTSVLLLGLFKQTINIMTLSGLALAIGVLVDQATVTIENIHQHLEMGKPKRRAILEACEQISFPLVLILLCILAVFAPSFVMTGVPKAMFLPLSLAIGFAMIASFVAAQTLVPVISNWLLKAERFRYHHDRPHAHAGLALDHAERREVDLHAAQDRRHPEENHPMQRLKVALMARLAAWMPRRKVIVTSYLVTTIAATGLAFALIGKDLLPKSNAGELQIRIKEPDGTRLEQTERTVKNILTMIDSVVNGNVNVSSAYVGLVPSSYGTSNLYVFNAGTNEAVVQVNLDAHYRVNIEELKDRLRTCIVGHFPGIRISFEPIELTEKIMAQGAATPIEVRVAGKDFDDVRTYAERLVDRLRRVGYLRDVQIAQPLRFPTIKIRLDRYRLAQMGLNLNEVARSITDATSSSRFTEKVQWLDAKVAYTYQVQVQVPEFMMNSMEQLGSIPLVHGQDRPVLSDVAQFSIDTLPGEYDRSGPRRFLTVSANLAGKDLGSATTEVRRAIAGLGPLPPGLVTDVRGMSSLLLETLGSLQTGLIAAIVVILLLLAANYQSFGLAIAVLATVPAVLLGALLALLSTGATLNLQSYMGIIMSTGVSVANAILIATNAETLRLEYRDPFRAAIMSAGIRLRPILMTTLAMVAGMIPMASGLGEAGDQSAPLGRAVIGGLLASTFAALLIVPLVYGWIQERASFDSVSLLPDEAPGVA